MQAESRQLAAAAFADLPVGAILPELRAALTAKRAVVLSAPPGSGKTTVVPLALLDEPWLTHGRILMLEPRRLAARMAARRMAELLGEAVGATVGYQIRFERLFSAATRIEVLTEGILTRRLQHDPELAGVGLVIFDEFHERSIHADLALALCLEVMAALRDDLRILIMSATLEIEPLARLLDDAGLVIGGGKRHPVQVRYLGADRPGTGGAGYLFNRIVAEMAAAIRRLAVEEHGDILAFLPGAGEIRAVAEAISAWARTVGLLICPLYGELTQKEQDAAVLPDSRGQRRIVLATAIAETSLTIEGVRVVIDSGWSRVSRFDPNSGLSRLTTVRISRAAAAQRCGRAGRLAPGVCCRLWRQGLDQGLAAHAQPEVLEADLAPLALELALWGAPDPGALRWLDPPPAGNFRQAQELLAMLGALDDRGRLTALGKAMAGLGVHPRVARMLLAAAELGVAEAGADLAAIITERDVIRQTEAGPRPADIEARLHLLACYRQGREGEIRIAAGEPAALNRVDRAARQYRGLLPRARQPKAAPPSSGGLLALSYPDRLARLRPDSGGERYLLASGRGVRLAAGDHLQGTPWLVAAHLDAGRTEGRILLASPITEQELFSRLAEHITMADRVAWDERLEQVVACREQRLFELVVNSRPLETADPAQIQQAMLAGVRRLGLAALPWTDEARALQARIMSLRLWQPEAGWPDVSDEALEDMTAWLGPHLAGMSRRRDLDRLDLAAILRGMLEPRLRQRLEIEAPTHLTVPSGSRLRLRYQPGAPPVLAVRLQEMFGAADTPRIASGRVAVMLHLLSPASRPVQVTQDLRGFWNTTYPEVKKQLKGRYPRHHWPDDPWAAAPTARVKGKTKA